jgi:uncharacterized membrane protein
VSRETHWHPETEAGRLTALSDGIFSVAMTLAVIQVMPPDLHARLRAEGVGKLLVELIPEFVGITTTFLLVGLYWVSHHRMFTHIRRVDRPLLFLNLMFLLGITFMPFFVAITAIDSPAAVAAYGVYIGTLALLMDFVWFYATHHRRLVDPHLDIKIIRYNHYRALISASIFLLSCPLAYYDTGWAKMSWILVMFNGRLAAALADR